MANSPASLSLITSSRVLSRMDSIRMSASGGPLPIYNVKLLIKNYHQSIYYTKLGLFSR